jgi:molecular chaperone DnaK
VFSVKRLMGKKFEEVRDLTTRLPYKVVSGPNGDAVIEIRGEQFTPQQISSFVLGAMKNAAEAYLGEKVTEAVITVPGVLQRLAAPGHEGRRPHRRPRGQAHHQRADGGRAGLRLDKKNDDDRRLRLGGGTFDISILELATASSR